MATPKKTLPHYWTNAECQRFLCERFGCLRVDPKAITRAQCEAEWVRLARWELGQ